MELIFSRAGYAFTGYAGPELLLSGDFELPEAIVLDRQLSGSDGLDVCRYLKSQINTQNIPIVMVSASMNIGELAKEAGADDFVEKPFRIKTLLEVVSKYVH
jgi:CheY-like chemotaxis protein